MEILFWWKRNHRLAEYGIKNLDVIILYAREKTTSSTSSAECDVVKKIECQCPFYKVGDPVDVILKEVGAWFEAKIVGIFLSASGTEKIYTTVMDRNEKTAPIEATIQEIRPRSKYKVPHSDVVIGMRVLVNYNVENPNELGYWYDFEVAKIFETGLEGTLHRGSYLTSIEECHIMSDNFMKIENYGYSSERNEELFTETTLRALPLYCTKCSDLRGKRCKECGCFRCGGKTSVDKMIMCDECNYAYHLYCLRPRLKEIPPDPEWYCPDCKVNPNEIVGPGQGPTSSKHNNQLESSHNQGVAANIEVGTTWKSLTHMYESGINNEYDLILDRTYQDVDRGDELYYTASSSNKMFNRNLIKIFRIRGEFCMIKDWRNGHPIRVIRGPNIPNSVYAPKNEYRFDGNYKIREYFMEQENERMIRRFLLKRDDPATRPWIKELPVTWLLPSLENFIGQDTINSAKWTECKSVRNTYSFLKKVHENFTCLICCELVNAPVTTPCQHIFCKNCLQKCRFSQLNDCPTCRSPLNDGWCFQVNRALEKTLHLIKIRYGSI